jgi:hypothetical protein
VKTYIALPTEMQNTLEEKILEEKIEQSLQTRTICGRKHYEITAFDNICDCDNLVILFGHITPEICWAVKIAVILKKILYVYNEKTNTLSREKEVNFNFDN